MILRGVQLKNQSPSRTSSIKKAEENDDFVGQQLSVGALCTQIKLYSFSVPVPKLGARGDTPGIGRTDNITAMRYSSIYEYSFAWCSTGALER